MFTKTFIIAAVSALASAQSATLSFTKVPNPITDGQPQAITYETNDPSSPVTIILRKGASNNLQTVQTLTTTATNGQFIWTPSTSLPDSDEYALEITQGDQTNYFGPFSIEGASASAYSSSSSASSTMSSSTSSGVTSTTATIVVSSSSGNATTSTVTPYGTGVGSSAGTGTTMARNTTMSSATLSGAKSTKTPASTSASGTASSAAGTTASTAGASAASSSSTSGSAALSGSSSLALVFGAVAALFYLQ